MGRSRGGLTTKIHALVDAEGRPIRLKLTEGQAHDGASARDMLEGIGAGTTLIADRAYDANWLRDAVAERGAWANVRPLAARKTSSPSARGSTGSETPWNASSTSSNISVRSPRATTNATTTSSPQSNSHPSASGYAQMSR